MKKKARKAHRGKRQAAKVGRPTLYTEALALQICERLASGQPLVKICRDDDMPHVATVYRWMADGEAFRDMYVRAREDQADTLADEIQAIADEPMLGERVTVKGKGKKRTREVVTGDMIEHRRLRVDARKWIAAKLKPKVYSERTTLQNPDGTPVNCVPVINLTVLPPAVEAK